MKKKQTKEKKKVKKVTKPKKIEKINKKVKIKKLKTTKIKKVDEKLITKPTKSAKLAKKPTIVSTGIPKLNKLVNGGFPFGSINLVVGGNGSGKTILALQFLLEGIKKGETVLYITFEEAKDEFYRNMTKLGWNLEALENKGKFIFLEYSPEKVKMMIDEGGGAIESTVLREGIKRLVIDSISSFSLLFEKPQEKRHAVLALFDIIRKWDLTTLLTLQKDQTKIKGETTSVPASVVEQQADSLILLYFIKIKNQRKRFIEVLKMRGTKHSKETYSFEIRKGINIGSKASMNN